MGEHRRQRHVLTLASLAGALCLAATISACGTADARAEHLSSGCREGDEIALTFDDGPDAAYTPQIIEILQTHGARATFFDEGEEVRAHPEIVTSEIDAGMAVGSHSYSHSADLPAMSRSDFGADLQRAQAALVNAGGITPALYRAPYGHTSATMLAALRAAGYESIGWDLDSTDWKNSSSVDDIVAAVLDGAHPGAIVLMHDGGLGGGDPDRSKTIAALPRILDGLHDRGYVTVTVPEITGMPMAQGGERRPACSAS
jgi:peptidoglycan/xylan/chitin deacetylase (PgdA/CDA1 family)